ncbi:MAG: tetratricopeptide repeat protein [Planctomycetota bacterium]
MIRRPSQQIAWKLFFFFGLTLNLLLAQAPSASTLLKQLGKDYQLEILSTHFGSFVTNSGGEIQAVQASTDSLQKYAPLLVQELRLYPKAFIQKLPMKRIILCTQLAYEKQLRAGIPYTDQKTLWLDVEFPQNYLRHTFHHELYHILDQADDGYLYQDNTWSALNRPEFRYGLGGRYMRDSEAAIIRYDIEGCLNRYSTSGVEEDKAEIFTYLITAPQKLEEFAWSDPIVRRKIRLLQRQIREFSPELDSSFWEKKNQNNSKESFWQEKTQFHFSEAMAQIRSTDWGKRRAAFRSLAKLSFKAEICLPLFLDALKEQDSNVRIEAVGCLGEFKSFGESILPILVEKSSDPNPFVQRAAQRAIQKINQTLEIEKEFLTISWGDVFQQAVEQYIQGNLSESLKKIQFLVRQYPTAEVYYYRASIYFTWMDWVSASENYSESIRLDPNYILSYYYRGSVRIEQQRFEEAATDYSQILNLDPTYGIAYYGRGLAYFRNNKRELAKQEFQHFLKSISPQNTDPFNQQAKTWVHQEFPELKK